MPIYLLIGASVFTLIMITYISISYYSMSEKEREEKGFSAKEFFSGIYDLLYKKHPEIMARRYGINVDKFINATEIIRCEPELKKLVIYRIFATAFLVVSILVALLNDTFYLVIFAVILCYLLIFQPISTIYTKAEVRKNRLENDLPRFMDLLITALKVNMPIENAIIKVSSNLDGVLAEELNFIAGKMLIENKSWKDELLALSKLYKVELFSDFVSDILTAHEKGLSIVDSLESKSRDIKKSYILRQKAKAARLQTAILAPVFITKLLPLIAILLIPVLSNIAKSF